MADTIQSNCIMCGNKMDSIPQFDNKICDDCKKAVQDELCCYQINEHLKICKKHKI